MTAVDRVRRVGRNVRAWRQFRGVSQRDLSRMLRQRGFGVHQAALSRVETGAEVKHRCLTADVVAEIAEVLDLPVEAMFAGCER